MVARIRFGVLAVILVFTAVTICALDGPIIVVTEVWPPFRISAPGTTHGFTGIDIEILTLMADRLALRIEVERHPFARCLEMLRTGDADLITGIAYTDERAEYIEYIPTSYWSVCPAFYTQTGRGAEITDYDDLYGYTIGYSLDSAYFEPFDSDTRLDKLGVSTEGQLLQMVALGRIDVTIGTEPNLGYDIARAGLRDELEPTAYAPDVATALYFGVSRGSDLMERVGEIDAFLADLLESPDLEAIRERYR